MFLLTPFFGDWKHLPVGDIFMGLSFKNGASTLPRETLFIDDSIQHIKGATEAGMQAVLLEKNASIIQIVPDIIQSIHR